GVSETAVGGFAPGRFLYRTHELGASTTNPTGVSYTDLVTGDSRILVRRSDWQSLDGIRWTPWGSLLFAEEASNVSGIGKDPNYPNAKHGLVYEVYPDRLDLTTGQPLTVARPALGSKAHEGMAFDSNGYFY